MIRNLIHITITGAIVFFLSSCSSDSSHAYLHPSQEQLKVNETCTLIYEKPYSNLLGTARESKARKIVIVDEGILVFFSDGKEAVLPIYSGLPLGNEYYCGSRRKSTTPCLSANDWDTQCHRSRPIPPNRFKY